MSQPIRICTKCGEAKPVSEYHRDSRSSDGYRRQCKPCRCSAVMDWWTANRERQLERHQAYVDANRERVRELDSERYWRNRDQRLDLATSVGHAKRARERGGDYDFTVTREALRERDGDACHYCRRVMDFERNDRKIRKDKATIEHVVPISAGGGHTFANTVLACWGCNSEKRNADADAFRERIERRQTPNAS